MSWSIKSIGPREAVKAEVLKNANIPDGLKTSIVQILDEPVIQMYPQYPDELPKYNDHARVEGYGHSGGGTGSIGKLEVELFATAKLSYRPPVAVTEVGQEQGA